MKTAKTSKSDWSSLLPEVLNLIVRNLNEISDFVRFRAVCTAWRSAAPITDQPPQFPWILGGFSSRYRENPYLRFYSIPFNRTQTIHAPNVMNNFFLRAFDMHLVLWNSTSRRYSIVNPLNDEHILLPVFPYQCSPFWIIGHQQDQKGENNSICCGFWDIDSKHKFVIYNVGNDNWCELKVEPDSSNQRRHFYLKGMLFVVELDTGVTEVIDATAGSLSYTIPPVVGLDYDLQPRNINLVEVSGDIYRVHQHYDNYSKTFSFDIHRMDAIESGSPRWVNTRDIGNHALFIHHIDGCFALRANSSCGIEANCIYHLGEIFTGRPVGYLRVLDKVDIKTGACERLPCPFQHVVRWFIPNLRRLRDR